MEFLRFLESIRTPVGDALMSFITLFGEETLFIVLALVFFWCIDKKRGFYLLFTCFAGTVCIQFLKMVFRIPRPWVLDPNFTIVESAREAATGYSFPSGHTQCAAGLWGGIARSAKKRAVQIGGTALALLVGFSRMYLGVHTPLDVLVSLGIALVVIFALYFVVYQGFDKPKRIYIACGVLLAATVANLLFVSLYPFPADVDVVNLANGQKTAWQMLALAIGVCIIYPLDRHYIKFETKAVWWAQILKLAIGVGLVLAVRVGLKTPLNAIFGVNLGAGVRYFLIVIVAGVLWPMTFKFWAKLGKKKEEEKS
jgi:membrane-associated phospholipid phosphatase